VPTLKKAAKPVNPLLNLELPNMDALVYPIPAKDVLFVNTTMLSDIGGEIVINIYNLNGILINTFSENAKTFNSIDISKISQGAYFIEISNNNQLVERAKILIVK